MALAHGSEIFSADSLTNSISTRRGVSCVARFCYVSVRQLGQECRPVSQPGIVRQAGQRSKHLGKTSPPLVRIASQLSDRVPIGCGTSRRSTVHQRSRFCTSSWGSARPPVAVRRSWSNSVDPSIGRLPVGDVVVMFNSQVGSLCLDHVRTPLTGTIATYRQAAPSSARVAVHAHRPSRTGRSSRSRRRMGRRIAPRSSVSLWYGVLRRRVLTR